MRVVLLVVLPALLVMGCGPSAGLLTGEPRSGDACFTDSATGQLVVEAAAGTAIIQNDTGQAVRTAVMWRPGYVDRPVGSEVQVLDSDGNVVAITGRSYRLQGAGVDGAFWACGAVTSL